MNISTNIQVQNRQNNFQQGTKKQINSKQNMRPKHKENCKIQPLCEGSTSKKNTISEGDFSRISQSYILQGNILKRQQVYGQEKMKSNKNQKQKKSKQTSKIANQQNQLRTKILKLEYLEQKGVLRPDQKQILNKYRGQKKHEAIRPTKQKQNEEPQVKKKFAQSKIRLDQNYKKIQRHHNIPYFTPKPHLSQDSLFYSSRKVNPLEKSQGPYNSSYGRMYPQYYA